MMPCGVGICNLGVAALDVLRRHVAIMSYDAECKHCYQFISFILICSNLCSIKLHFNLDIISFFVIFKCRNLLSRRTCFPENSDPIQCSWFDNGEGRRDNHSTAGDNLHQYKDVKGRRLLSRFAGVSYIIIMEYLIFLIQNNCDKMSPHLFRNILHHRIYWMVKICSWSKLHWTQQSLQSHYL